MTRRTLLESSALPLLAQAARAQRPAPKSWHPKLGIFCRFSPANLEFARQEGFTCAQLAIGPGLQPDTSGKAVDEIKETIRKSGVTVVALSASVNHLDPNPAARERIQTRFVQTLELAAALDVPYVGTSSGAVPGQAFDKQVADVVKVYEAKYFPLCEKHHLRILWEPYVNPGNIAVGPVGFSALLTAFHDSPFVGIQLDPSHLAWQMIDPAACAREFAGKIFNIHLKDTEILPAIRRVGIQPPDGTRWWRFRIPGSGSIDWRAFFTALADTGYNGGMNIENEDSFFYPNYDGDNFTESFKAGFRAAHAYLRQFVPERG
jgi:Sugar phosphate isomerases/epimerases